MDAKTDPDVELAADVGSFWDDPLGLVMYMFPWGEPGTPLEHYDGPDEWQRDFLIRWGDAIKKNNFNGVDPVSAYQDATASGHGIGKSAMASWIILIIMGTRPFSKGVVTANTSDQLRTKTWGELAKWKKLCIFGHWFEYNNGKGNMNIYHPAHKETWRVDAQVCREENSESFAGLHAANSTPWYLFDEASAVPDLIWEVAEGGLTDGEPFFFCFGNPTRNSGRFRECFRKFRHRWSVRHVDSRTARMTNKEKIEEWRNDYGEDSDFFKVRVKGVFPSAGSLQFINQDLVDAAMRVQLTERQVAHAPVIIGVDPAYTGEDDFVIYMRQGLNSRMLGKYERTDDDLVMAKLIAQFEDNLNADAVHIDFGYGTGIYSVGKSWGRNWRLVPFGGKSTDPQMLNKRGEMYNSVKSWLKDGGSIDDQQLADELVMPEFRVRTDGKVVLEAKEEIKKRLGCSPNRADALALTFAYPVTKKQVSRKQSTTADSEYDPYAN